MSPLVSLEEESTLTVPFVGTHSEAQATLVKLHAIAEERAIGECSDNNLKSVSHAVEGVAEYSWTFFGSAPALKNFLSIITQ